MRALTLSLLFVSLAPARAADEIGAFDRARRRAGAWLGMGAVSGALRFDADSAALTSHTNAMPTLAFGVDLWPEEHLGLYLEGLVGIGTRLEYAERGISLDYNSHQLELGARYRWHLGPQASALAPFVGLGLRALHQRVPQQIPSLLVRSTAVGPELSLGLEWPVWGERLWLRASGRLGLPFFLREGPDDSGDPHEFLSLGGRGELVLSLFGDWAGFACVDWQRQRFGFQGEGTRAATVFDARTDERFLRATAGVRAVF